MSEPTKTWAADGSTLIRNGRATGFFPSDEIAEWVANACNTAQLPPDGQGRWRQGTKNPRNLYVHQGDDEVGQPVGQMYSDQLAALVCDAVNATGRIREIHPRESTGFRDVCGACFDERGDQFTWPCPTIEALGQDGQSVQGDR